LVRLGVHGACQVRGIFQAHVFGDQPEGGRDVALHLPEHAVAFFAVGIFADETDEIFALHQRSFSSRKKFSSWLIFRPSSDSAAGEILGAAPGAAVASRSRALRSGSGLSRRYFLNGPLSLATTWGQLMRERVASE